MNSKLLSGIALFLTFFGSKTLMAQDTSAVKQPAVWDLQSCIEYARKNNIQINSLRLSKQTNEQELLLSKSAVLPNLNGAVSQDFSHYNLNQSGNPRIGSSGSLGLSSSWTIYNGGYLRTDIQQKDLSVEAANQNVLASENDITLQITQAYLNILVDKENIVYNTDLVKTSQSQLQQAQNQYKAGSIARKDLVQLEAQLASDQYLLTVSQNAERQDKLSLKQLLQLPSNLATTFDIVKPDTIVPVKLVSPLEEVQNNALQNRPEVKSSQLNVQIADLNLQKARAGYKPVLTASGGIGTNYSNNDFYTTLRQFDNNFYQQVGLTLSIPIFTRRLNKTNVQEAKISIDQAKLDLQNTRTILSLNVEQAYINVVNAQNQYNSAIEQLKYNQEIYRIATNELKVGAANVFTFYQQRNLYVQALQAYIQAKYNAALSVKIYDFYSGVPVKL